MSNLKKSAVVLTCLILAMLVLPVPEAGDLDTDYKLSRTSESNPITAKVIDAPQKTYREYWDENNKDIALKFNSYVEEFSPLYCIDYPDLRKFLELNSKVENFADELTVNSTDTLDTAYVLHQFVYRNIQNEKTEEFLGVEEVLNQKRGSCSGKSLLLSSLLEAKGITSYVADGFEHRYVFARINGTWMPIDSTTPDFYFVYKIWDSVSEGKYYHGPSNMQSFMFNRTETIFNKDWCSFN